MWVLVTVFCAFTIPAEVHLTAWLRLEVIWLQREVLPDPRDTYLGTSFLVFLDQLFWVVGFHPLGGCYFGAHSSEHGLYLGD